MLRLLIIKFIFATCHLAVPSINMLCLLYLYSFRTNMLRLRPPISITSQNRQCLCQRPLPAAIGQVCRGEKVYKTWTSLLWSSWSIPQPDICQITDLHSCPILPGSVHKHSGYFCNSASKTVWTLMSYHPLLLYYTAAWRVNPHDSILEKVKVTSWQFLPSLTALTEESLPPMLHWRRMMCSLEIGVCMENIRGGLV